MDPVPVTSRPLVVGYGNTLRGDDGVGPRVAELLATDPRLAGAVVLARHQLTPELAADIAEASVVVFVDASENGQPGAISVRRIDRAPRDATLGMGGEDRDRSEPEAGSGSAAWTHHVDAESLLALARELWGGSPAAFVVGVGVEAMELGDDLSADVERALPAVIEAVARIVAEHARG